VQEGASNSSLVIRLKEIFGFVTAEEVISGLLGMTIVIYQLADKILEYPCWLLQSVLLQGYMYITQHHICFYAYLPKKSVSYHPRMQTSQAHDLQELDRKVRIPRQKRETEPQIQSLLVHTERRRTLILCRPRKPLFSEWKYRSTIWHFSSAL